MDPCLAQVMPAPKCYFFERAHFENVKFQHVFAHFQLIFAQLRLCLHIFVHLCTVQYICCNFNAFLAQFSLHYNMFCAFQHIFRLFFNITAFFCVVSCICSPFFGDIRHSLKYLRNLTHFKCIFCLLIACFAHYWCVLHILHMFVNFIVFQRI